MMRYVCFYDNKIIINKFEYCLRYCYAFLGGRIGVGVRYTGF